MATTGGTNLRDDIMRLDETGKLAPTHAAPRTSEVIVTVSLRQACRLVESLFPLQFT